MRHHVERVRSELLGEVIRWLNARHIAVPPGEPFVLRRCEVPVTPAHCTEEFRGFDREFDELLGRIVRLLAESGKLNEAALQAVASLAAVSAEQPAPYHEGAVAMAGNPVSVPLDAARERGRRLAVEEWEKPDNLPLKEAASLAGRSDRMLNLDRQAGRLYALVLPGRERGFRYPSWQFNVDAGRLAAALAPFVQAGASCWVIHNFMSRPQEDLQGQTPAGWIADAMRPIDAVVRLAEARYGDQQGAA